MEINILQKKSISSEIKLIGENLLDKLKKEFRSDLVALVFYGSRIRGDNFPESDLDTLIILKQTDNREIERTVSAICGELTRKYFIKVSPYLISEDDFEFGARNLFPFNLGVFLRYETFYGHKYIEACHQFITNAIQEGILKIYPRSGIFIQK